MDSGLIEGVIFTPLSIIGVEGGDVLHAMRVYDHGFNGFGEAYFSTVEAGAIKGWKMHNEMVLNLVVPAGSVRFVVFDARIDSKTEGSFCEFVLSRSNYGRLTVPPKLWVGFQGIYERESLLLNIANIPHDPDEVSRQELDKISFDWSIK